MAELKEFEAVLRDHKLECPACHQPLEVKVRTKVKTSSARTAGGDTFNTKIVVDVQVSPLSLSISHECELPAKEN